MAANIIFFKRKCEITFIFKPLAYFSYLIVIYLAG